jgi:uncharacterized membrane protein YbaN (DUF454 family)
MPPAPQDYSHEVRKHDSLAVRLVFAALGAAFLVAGAVGIVVPVLPTVPLWLVAAACFARSSSRVYNWLLNHRHFGPGIREWRHHRSIPYRAKRAALALLAVSFGITLVFFLASWPSRLAMGAGGLLLAAWIWRIPSRDAPRQAANENRSSTS